MQETQETRVQSLARGGGEEGESSGGGNGNPLQYSCLKNSMDRGAKQAIVYKVTKSQTWLRNSAGTRTHIYANVSNLLWQRYQSYRRCYNGEAEGKKGIEELPVLSLQLLYKAKIIPRQKVDLKNTQYVTL